MRQYAKKGVFGTFSHLTLALKRIDEQGLVQTPWVSPDVRVQVVESAENLSVASTAQDVCASKLEQARKQYREDGNRLVRFVRDFFVVLNRTGNRQGQREALSKVFGQPKRIPRSVRFEVWQAMTRKIIAAEPEARALNLPEPINPTVAELAMALASLEASAEAFFKAKVELKACMQETNERRKEGQRVLNMVAARLRESLHKLPKGARRDMMRTFGFRFSDVPTGGDVDNKVNVDKTQPGTNPASVVQS